MSDLQSNLPLLKEITSLDTELLSDKDLMEIDASVITSSISLDYHYVLPIDSDLDLTSFALPNISYSSPKYAAQYQINVDFGSSTSLVNAPEYDHSDFYPVANEAVSEVAGIITTINAPSTATALTSFDLNNVFKLHSNVNAKHTIYLDFDGHISENTYWNDSTLPKIISPAYDTDGNVAVFSAAERQDILAIWQRVVEDFAPFEVNVTTEAPNVEDLKKSSNTDTRWGMRVLMTQNINLVDNTQLFSSGTGGIAYVGSFTNSSDTPVFAFNKGENNAAMTVSHEVGHSLGLNHDGTVDTNPADTINDAKSYFSGYGSGDTSWGSLLGAPFNKSLTQWSKGEYQYADNQEDDLAIITTDNGFGYRTDDFGDSNSTATRLYADATNKISAFGIIERNTDKDVFSFSTNTGNINLNITAASRSYISDGNGNFNQQYLAARGSNLDLWAGIYSADGSLVAQSNPTDLLSASFTNLFLNAGLYYLQIDGVGKTGPNGYSDYGSLGQYAIDGTIIKTNNAVPVLNSTLLDQTILEDAAFTWTLPINTFSDPDAGDVLTYSAKLGDGNILPSWLSFNQITQTFSGKPTIKNVGSIDVKVTVTDVAGDVAEDIFTFIVKSGLNDVIGSDLANTLSGSTVADYITGLAGNDTLTGLGGNDYLDGGIGDDYLNGGVGNDELQGGAGNDILDGSGDSVGLDTFAGGAGDDVYGIYNSATVIIEDAGAGTDTVWTAVNFTLAANVENMYLVGAINGIGNDGNNIISGYGAGNNSINGLGGNDTLIGGDGNDTLNGGTGNDNLQGGTGNDILDGSGDSIGLDTFAGGAGDDIYGIYNSATVIIEDAGAGTDTVWTAVNFTLAANVENLYLVGAVNGTGNNGNNVITGYGAGNNNINGFAGNDSIDGGEGNDTINGGAGSDTLNGGAGADTFSFQFGQSTYLAADRITDFTIGTDKFSLFSPTGVAALAPTSLSRTGNDAASTTLLALVQSVYADANGALTGNQALTLGGAAIVASNSAAIAGTYLIIDDGIAGLSTNDLVVNITRFSGTLPTFGAVPVNSFFN